MKQLLLILFMAAFHAGACSAQSMVGSNSGAITVYQVVSASVTTVGSLPTLATASDYINGKTVTGYGSVSVKANVNWLLSVKATTANFSPMSTGASSNMPAGKLSIKKSGGSNFLTLSTSNQTLATGNKGSNSVSGNTFNTDIKFNPGFGYGGGLYRLTLMYTITNQ